MLGPRQGRFTYQTKKEAETRCGELYKNSSKSTLKQVFGTDKASDYSVAKIRCYPGHFDPIGGFYMTDEEVFGEKEN
jgi:hypothetical protein